MATKAASEKIMELLDVQKTLNPSNYFFLIQQAPYKNWTEFLQFQNEPQSANEKDVFCWQPPEKQILLLIEAICTADIQDRVYKNAGRTGNADRAQVKAIESILKEARACDYGEKFYQVKQKNNAYYLATPHMYVKFPTRDALPVSLSSGLVDENPQELLPDYDRVFPEDNQATYKLSVRLSDLTAFEKTHKQELKDYKATTKYAVPVCVRVSSGEIYMFSSYYLKKWAAIGKTGDTLSFYGNKFKLWTNDEKTGVKFILAGMRRYENKFHDKLAELVTVEEIKH